MRALSYGFELVDLQSSWHSIYQTQISTFACLKNAHFISPGSAAIHRTGSGGKAISPSTSAVPSIRSPEIRRPSDRIFPRNGSSLNPPISSLTTSISTTRLDESASELELFLELVPVRMRNALASHEDIEDLIEVVMDLGRKPLARFPSGDWIISDEPVKHEDLQNAISKGGQGSIWECRDHT